MLSLKSVKLNNPINLIVNQTHEMVAEVAVKPDEKFEAKVVFVKEFVKAIALRWSKLSNNYKSKKNLCKLNYCYEMIIDKYILSPLYFSSNVSNIFITSI